MTIRSLNGRLTGVHKVLCSDAEIACKGRRDFYLGHDGGYMIPIQSKNGQGLSANIFNFCVSREVKPTETNNVNKDQLSGRVCRAVRSQV